MSTHQVCDLRQDDLSHGASVLLSVEWIEYLIPMHDESQRSTCEMINVGPSISSFPVPICSLY